MHEQGVAHRYAIFVIQPRSLTTFMNSDATYKNLMMDANAMFPQGFHPVETTELPSAEGPAPFLPRLLTAVKYYFVDFGISVRIPRDADQKRVLGIDGLDREVPELSSTVPYDPFKVDIFIIGNVFRSRFLAVCPSLTLYLAC